MDEYNFESENLQTYFELWCKLQKCAEPEEFDLVRKEMNRVFSLLPRKEKTTFKTISENYEKFGSINGSKSSKKKKNK